MQWMPAKPVRIGDELEITAKHDTYGVSFSFQDAAEQLNGMVNPPTLIHFSAKNKMPCSEVVIYTVGFSIGFQSFYYPKVIDCTLTH